MDWNPGILVWFELNQFLVEEVDEVKGPDSFGLIEYLGDRVYKLLDDEEDFHLYLEMTDDFEVLDGTDPTA